MLGMITENELQMILSSFTSILYPPTYQPSLTDHCACSALPLTASLKPCPAAGTFEMAAKPLGTSANFKPADGDK